MMSQQGSQGKFPATVACMLLLLFAAAQADGQTNYALQFNGSSQYVTFGRSQGPDTGLGAASFTIECWFKRTGTGVAGSTGSSSINAIPLVTKGRGEADGSTVDCNYFLGINVGGTGFYGASGVLAADFEEGTGTASPGLNHPVCGVTQITNNVWYHAAATYDTTARRWRLYLNGNLEKDTVIQSGTRFPQYLSIQHAGLGTAMTSTGVAAGFLQGVIDEARIWNVARTQGEIQATMNSEVTSGTGLIGRWGLNDGSGPSATNSVGGRPAGTLTNGPTWVAGAPALDPPPVPPVAPSNLTATAPSAYQINLSWTDNSTNETSFEIWRSTDGGSSFALRASTAANATSYQDTLVNSAAQYFYRVRAANGAGTSAYTADANTTTGTEGSTAFQFGNSNAYVTFGQATSTLGAQTFTLECWFKRNGLGVVGTTGSGGIENTAVPILTKGRNESDGSNVDMNYWLGIDSVGARIAADFEDFATGLNHPVRGTTRIMNGVWYHAAATYDGTTWKLYLNGTLEGTVVVNQTPRYDCIQHAGLGTALNSTGVAAGFFNGEIDEARIWNYARTGSEVAGTINSQIIAPQTGLLARWGLNEGSGTKIHGNAGVFVNGTAVGTGSSWVAGAPFDLVFTPPNAPSNLVVTPISNSILQLTWTDNATNETGFEIERSTTGPGGPFTPLATVAANTVSYNNTGLTSLTDYCYRVRATNGLLQSAYTSPACGTTPASVNNALDLGSAGAFVTFGAAPGLATPTFTVETWFKRTGTGTPNTTGGGGIDIIPLLTKGSPETEGGTVDENYILGIQSVTNVIAADFEEGTGSTTPAQNHPLVGITPVTDNVWHHAAATFANGVFKIYLDGVLENTLNLGTSIFPQGASIQHAGLGTMINSTGTAVGKFQGILDEARIWNYARTLTEIRSTINTQITTTQPGLLARWGLNEETGTVVNASAGTTANGTVTGTGSAWVPGAPFNLLNVPPNAPALNAPANSATGVSIPPTLDVTVSDPDGGNVTVSFYGRQLGTTAVPDFTIVGLPDTQYYTGELNGGSNAILKAQMNWIVSNRVSKNIVYVATLGDCVEHGDNGSDPIEWQRADTSFTIIENPLTTGLLHGIPYGVTVGNHDQSPNGTPGGTTFYNQYFGVSRFTGRTYYGGHYGGTNNNWYDLFSTGGTDFIAISLEYDTTPDVPILDWADQLLTTYSNRRAIVLSHWIVNTGNPGSFSAQGQAVYDRLKTHSNLFLMLCGHVPGEGRRSDTFNGNTVNSLLADYQGRTAGGNGWMRILEFSPANNVIHVKTYSPTLGTFETDADSQFDIPYNPPPGNFELIGTSSGVASGSSTTMVWPGLLPSTQYEWYVTVNDGIVTTAGPTWSFTTLSSHTITASTGSNGSISPSGAVSVPHNGSQSFTITPNSGYQIASVVVDGLPAATTSPYVFSNVTADHTIAVTFSPASGVPETVVCADSGTYTFPLSQVTMFFGAMPSGGGNVTVRRYPETPPSPTYPDPPPGSTYIPLWFDITSTLPNDSFNDSITVDVTGVSGFSTTSKVMYYNATSGRWVLVGGTYNAGAQTMKFATTHFTAFAFINTPETAYDLFVSTSPAVASAGAIYPNATWAGGYPARSDDWGFTGTQAFSLYLVPQVGTQIGACELVAEWDSAVVSLDGVVFTGSIFSGPNLLFAGWDRLGTGNRVTLNASLISPTNATATPGSYIARLDMRLRKPGHSAVSLIGDHVTRFNVGMDPSYVYVTPRQGEVKAYLPDVTGGSEASGDGMVDFLDLFTWSLSYWSGVPPYGMTAYKSKFDFGPTQNGSVFSLPLYDLKIDFEDLVVFSIGYGQTARGELPKIVPQTAPAAVSLGRPARVGDEIRVPVMIGGGVPDLRAMSIAVGGEFGSFLGAEKGALLQSYQTPVMVLSRTEGHTVYVDCAVMGLDAQGLNGEGEVLVLRFGGTTSVGLTKAECRTSANARLDITVSKEKTGPAPSRYSLEQNYPNPFNPTTVIEYQTLEPGRVTLEVFTVLGEKVATLVNDVKEAGYYRQEWNGKDQSGRQVASGVYIYRLKAGDFSSIRSMLLLK